MNKIWQLVEYDAIICGGHYWTMMTYPLVGCFDLTRIKVGRLDPSRMNAVHLQRKQNSPTIQLPLKSDLPGYLLPASFGFSSQFVAFAVRCSHQCRPDIASDPKTVGIRYDVERIVRDGIWIHYAGIL